MGNDQDVVPDEAWEREFDRQFMESLRRPGYDVYETINEFGVKVFRCVRQKKPEL